MKFRVKFEKLGAIRFSSHKDVLRIFQRCFGACNIPVSYSLGYHPHMKMSFGPPLKTGWESHEEYMDVHTGGAVDDLARACNDFLPEGLCITGFVELGDGAGKLANAISAVRMEVYVHKTDVPELAAYPAGDAGCAATLEKYKDNISRRFAHAGGTGDTNGKPPEIIDVTITNGDETICIDYTSTMLSGRVVQPDQVVDAVIGDSTKFRFPLRAARRAQYVRRNGEYLSPMSQGVIKN